MLLEVVGDDDSDVPTGAPKVYAFGLCHVFSQ